MVARATKGPCGRAFMSDVFSELPGSYQIEDGPPKLLFAALESHFLKA